MHWRCESERLAGIVETAEGRIESTEKQNEQLISLIELTVDNAPEWQIDPAQLLADLKEITG